MTASVHGIKKVALLIMLVIWGLIALAPQAFALSRIKDLADVEGVRDNLLVGYGLVVGLNGTGDSLNNSPFTKQSLESMLERMGVNTRGSDLKTKNVAAVMVTANLAPFATQGTRTDVTISALGDAKSLRGGTLLVTPLVGADSEVYAVAQGSIVVGGFTAEGDGGSVSKGVTTNGRIANGAIVERELNHQFAGLRQLRLSLRNPDLTTAKRMADAINTYLGSDAATTLNPTTVTLAIPGQFNGNMVALLSEIEQLRVQPDQMARVVIDEQSGIIVMGQEVRVNKVAIAQGNLTIRVTETPQVSQPSPFAEAGETVTVPRTDIEVDEDADNKLMILETGVTLQELVNGLNALGVGPQDMISILQTLKAAGALQAEVEVI